MRKQSPLLQRVRAALLFVAVWTALRPAGIAQAQAASPTQAVALVRQGEADQAQGRAVAAEESYRRACAMDPGALPPLTHLAAVLEQEGQTNAAIGFWRAAARLAPAAEDIRFALASALLAQGDNQEAASLLRELASAGTGNRGAVLADLGTALARLGEYDDAARTFEAALAFPDVADLARLSLVKSLCTLLHYPQAKPYAQQYLADHPHSYDALYFVGLIDSGLGEGSAAEPLLRAAVALDPSRFEGQLQLGELLRHEGKTQESVAPLMAAVSLRPDSKDAHFQLARALDAAGRPAEAQQQYGLLKQLEQQDAVQTKITILDNQASAAMEQQDTKTAAALYNRIQALEPRNAKVLYDLAMLSLDAGDTNRSRALLEKALALAPEMPEANAELGYLDMRDGQPALAEKELGRALAADPQSPQALGNLGVLDAQRGQLDTSLHELQLAVESDPAYVQGHLNLGLVLAAVGRAGAAQAELRRALALAPGDPRAVKALDLLERREPDTGRPAASQPPGPE